MAERLFTFEEAKLGLGPLLKQQQAVIGLFQILEAAERAEALLAQLDEKKKQAEKDIKALTDNQEELQLRAVRDAQAAHDREKKRLSGEIEEIQAALGDFAAHRKQIEEEIRKTEQEWELRKNQATTDYSLRTARFAAEIAAQERTVAVHAENIVALEAAIVRGQQEVDRLKSEAEQVKTEVDSHSQRIKEQLLNLRDDIVKRIGD